MISPRWKKMLGDLSSNRTRSVLMSSAIVVGIFSVTTILSTYAILSREMTQNYMQTNPASATLDVGEVTASILDTARGFPGIAEVEARSVIHARVKVGPAWKPMLLFVVEDFDNLRLNTFTPLGGSEIPPHGTMLIERTAQAVLFQGVGGAVSVQTPNGAPVEVPIVGLVHDATLAPAQQQQSGYGYISRHTLGLLGEAPILEELRIQLDGNPNNLALVEETSRALARQLIADGHAVHEIRVPPPLTHPHQTQMTAVLYLFLVFAAMAFLLSTILIATIIASLLTRQIREIGVMKAVGARSSQIARLYLSMLLGVGLFGALIGIPTGSLLAAQLVNTMGTLLNLEIHSTSVPGWVYIVLIVSSLVVPPLVALGVIIKGTTLSVSAAIADNGIEAMSTKPSYGPGLPWFGLSWNMAFRNMLRHRGRLYLALILLSIGGGMFISALNLNSGWAAIVDRIYTERSYDVEFILNTPTSKTDLVETLSAVSAVDKVEFWGYANAAFAEGDRIDISRTYPDGGHGNFVLMGVPPNTAMIQFPLLEGRWLNTGDDTAVVLNQIAKHMAQDTKLGDSIVLSIDGVRSTWRLVGVVEEIGSSAAAYVVDSHFEATLGTQDSTQLIRLSTSTNEGVEREALIQSIDNKLTHAGVSIKNATPLTLLKTTMGEHVALVVVTLIMMATLLGLIGLLGLMSTMSMNVLERTREIGIMKVSGATPATIQKIIVIEALLIAVGSWLLAIVVSLPLSAVMGSLIGDLSFKTPLGLQLSVFAVSLWFGLVVFLAALASLLPARKASKMPVYEAITYG